MPLVPTSGGPGAVMVHHDPRIGDFLVDGKGYALYMFPPDDRKAVTCTDECLGSWPPVLMAGGVEPHSGPGMDHHLLGSLRDAKDRMQITYAGWPLYRYAGDTAAGQINGQGLNLNGDQWYLLTPQGNPIVPPNQRDSTDMSAMGSTMPSGMPMPGRSGGSR